MQQKDERQTKKATRYRKEAAKNTCRPKSKLRQARARLGWAKPG